LIWQDYVIAAGSIIFVLALLPQLIECYHGGKINVISATLTASVLGVFCVVYASLGLWLAAVPFTAVVWGLIAWFSWRNRHG